MIEVSIYIKCPEGFYPTGEYRAPKANETYLAIDNDGDWVAMSSARDHSKDAPQIILMERKKKKVKK